jgi:hypothetical protein
MEEDILVLTVVSLLVLTWIVYKVRKMIERIDVMDQTYSTMLNELGFMLGATMDHLKVVHPDDIPNAPDLNKLVSEWDNN